MKFSISKIWISFILLIAIIGSIAAINISGANAPLESWGQLTQVAGGNDYDGRTFTASTDIWDTTGAACSLFVSKEIYTSSALTDSFTPAPLPGNSPIVFTMFARKGQLVATSLNPVVICTLLKSNDGVKFTQVVGATVFSLTPTSATVPLSCSWDLTAKMGRFFCIRSSVATDTAALQSQWWMAQNLQYQKTP